MMLGLINQFVYRPDATFAPAGFTPADLGLVYEEIALKTADDISLSAWFLPAANAQRLLLYFHGNAGDIRDWVHAAPPFVTSGSSVLIVDYRGYGRSQGQPSEAGLYRDGQASWVWLRKRADENGLPAFILGKSLGSAVAISVAAKENPAGLILDSAFTSMREVVAQNAFWLPQVAIPRLFESLELIPGITCPTLVIHGERDSLVPLSHGRLIYETLGAPKAMAIIDGADHNDLTLDPAYHQHINRFLADPLSTTGHNG